MKLKISKNIALSCIAMGGLLLSSCNDFLDREPLDQVTPTQYFNAEADLATYTVSYYSFPVHSGWGVGTLSLDNGTDNQATSNANYNLYVKGNWKVPENAGGNWDFSRIRAFNYFFEQVLPKYEAKSIQGSEKNIKHYIGEMYFLRALEYFNKLKMFGDFPIVTSTLVDQHNVLMEASKRRPRNEVARFIIEDLDKAIDLMQESFKNKNRLTKNAALLLKSRVALYEASFLTYHRGTPRVPGEAGWPGANMDYNKGFSINLDAEIDYFLTQAMESSKLVADQIDLTPNSGNLNPAGTSFANWNPYFEMFSAVDMSKYDEVIFWKSYNADYTTHGVSVYIRNGGNYGLTKGFVDGFVMKNGLPIYATGSGYSGDESIMKTKTGRDDRLQLFLAGEEDRLSTTNDTTFFGAPNIIGLEEVRDVTGYRMRKCFSYDPTQAPGSELMCTYGSIVYRGVEAYLNYIEASYMKNKSINATAANYWRAIRERAGVDTDFNKTINATNLALENDLGKYSGEKLVDATLFNIRRERRNEFMGEGMRMDDLKRWRSMDMVKDYVVEGFNLWDEAYKAKNYYEEVKVNGVPTGEIKNLLISDGSAKANVSNKSLSKYLRPYQKVKANNEVYNGYNWSKANYLYPIGVRELQLASPNQDDASQSTIYQNPYWPITSGPAAE